MKSVETVKTAEQKNREEIEYDFVEKMFNLGNTVPTNSETINEIEQEFLDDVGQVEGFFRRADGKIERLVDEDETWTEVIKGEYYDRVEIVSEDEFLIYIYDLTVDEEERRVEYEEERQRIEEYRDV